MYNHIRSRDAALSVVRSASSCCFLCVFGIHSRRSDPSHTLRWLADAMSCCVAAMCPSADNDDNIRFFELDEGEVCRLVEAAAAAPVADAGNAADVKGDRLPFASFVRHYAGFWAFLEAASCASSTSASTSASAAAAAAAPVLFSIPPVVLQSMKQCSSNIVIDIIAIAAASTCLHDEGFGECVLSEGGNAIHRSDQAWLEALKHESDSAGGIAVGNRVVWGLICLSVAIASVPSHTAAVAACLSQNEDVEQQQLASSDMVSGAIGFLGWFVIGVQNITANRFNQRPHPDSSQQKGVLSALLCSLSEMTRELRAMKSTSCTLVLPPHRHLRCVRVPADLLCGALMRV
jgi:hypothetical protein